MLVVEHMLCNAQHLCPSTNASNPVCVGQLKFRMGQGFTNWQCQFVFNEGTILFLQVFSATCFRRFNIKTSLHYELSAAQVTHVLLVAWVSAGMNGEDEPEWLNLACLSWERSCWSQNCTKAQVERIAYL